MASDLVTLDELKGYLGIINNDKADSLLQTIIHSSTAFLLSQMNRGEGLDHEYQYTKGITEIPEDIRLACLELAAVRYREKDRIGEVSKAIGNQTITYSQKDLSDFGRSVINHYKRVTP